MKNICVEVAPSTWAASNKEPSIPIIPAIRRMVVLPNHIMQFMKAIKDLVAIVLEKNTKGFDNMPN